MPQGFSSLLSRRRRASRRRANLRATCGDLCIDAGRIAPYDAPKWSKVVGSGEYGQHRAKAAALNPADQAEAVQGVPHGCSPASTGTRWTTRDGWPSLRTSAPSSRRARSCRAGSTPASRSTPEAGWDALADKVAALPDHRPGARAFQRFIFAGAFEVELDGQGRVLVPAYLREMAGLERRGGGRRLARPRRDLGAGPLGRLPPGARRPRRRSPRPSRASGSRPHHMRFQGPLGIRSSTVEER